MKYRKTSGRHVHAGSLLLTALMSLLTASLSAGSSLNASAKSPMTCVEIIDGDDSLFARWKDSDDSRVSWLRIVEYRNDTSRGSRFASYSASRRRALQTGSGSEEVGEKSRFWGEGGGRGMAG